MESTLESIVGKRRVDLGAPALAARLAGYARVVVDLGTGDGRYVRHVAATCPRTFAIGVDSCREPLRAASRGTPTNALYLIARAEALPVALAGLADEITINFPWGSLQAGLLAGEAALLDGLGALARPGARIMLRLNGGVLAEQGCALDEGAEQVRRMLCGAGFSIRAPVALDADGLRAYPSTWAHRLAFGRDPRAIALAGVYRCGHQP